MSDISVTMDAKAVLANLGALINKIPGAAAAADEAVAYEILRLSQMEVPHDEGTLQNSGVVEKAEGGGYDVGYHEVYAARLHEHPEYHFQKGRKGKYLEDPVLRNAEILGLQYTKALGDGLA